MLTAKEMRDGAKHPYIDKYNGLSWVALKVLILLQRKAGRKYLYSWLMDSRSVLKYGQVKKLEALGYKVTIDNENWTRWEIEWYDPVTPVIEEGY